MIPTIFFYKSTIDISMKSKYCTESFIFFVDALHRHSAICSRTQGEYQFKILGLNIHIAPVVENVPKFKRFNYILALCDF